MSAPSPLKRPAASDLPTPHRLAAAFKKPRAPQMAPLPLVSSWPRLSPSATSTNTTATATTAAPHASGKHKQKPNHIPPAVPTPLGLLHHNIPRGLYPVVYPPYHMADFFTDLHTLHPPAVTEQMRHVTATFPPPLPPMVPPGAPRDPGIMVPFVYPPVPVLVPDAYATGTAKYAGAGGETGAHIYPVLAPLPFPPPGYMPYPLLSHQAPLTPHEVFGDWLEALDHLPRVDMVVASAAGSIYDLGALALLEGWTVARLDHYVHSHRESDPEADDARSDSDVLDSPASGYRNYADYADQVDTTNAVDPHALSLTHNRVVVSSSERQRYLQVKPVELAQGRTLDQHHHATCEYTDADLHGPQGPVAEPPVADGSKKRTRADQLKARAALGEYECATRASRYAAKKRALLARLRRLQHSRVSYSDRASDIDDAELCAYATRRLVERDHELLRLKHSSHYEKLKTALAFYQTSNRAYKNMSLVVTNRLQKLKNFLEYQRLVLAAVAEPDADIYSIRTKESAKLYNSFITQDYGGEIKNVFRTAAANEDRGIPGDSQPDFDASWFDKVFVDQVPPAIVHDFMPLVTDEEFNLVTGDAPQKATAKEPNGKLKVAKHAIFQNPLYDVALSGSETAISDGGTLVMKKRPGRRAAPKSNNPEEVNKLQTEAALVAKIMKLFVGPAAANADELNHDLDLIGIKTKWPVK